MRRFVEQHLQRGVTLVAFVRAGNGDVGRFERSVGAMGGRRTRLRRREWPAAQDLAKCDNEAVKVTSRYNALKAARRHPDSVTPVTRWLTVITAAECRSLMDVRKFYPSADQVGKTLIFNVGGNNYRLLCCVSWELQRLFFRALLTHAEYDRTNVEALCP